MPNQPDASRRSTTTSGASPNKAPDQIRDREPGGSDGSGGEIADREGRGKLALARKTQARLPFRRQAEAPADGGEESPRGGEVRGSLGV